MRWRRHGHAVAAIVEVRKSGETDAASDDEHVEAHVLQSQTKFRHGRGLSGTRTARDDDAVDARRSELVGRGFPGRSFLKSAVLVASRERGERGAGRGVP